MNSKAALALFVVAAIGGTVLLMTIVSAGKDYEKAQNTRIEQMRAHGMGSR